MTVRELINKIIDTCESFDQEVDLRAECCDDYEPATHRERLDIRNKNGKLELNMGFNADFLR